MDDALKGCADYKPIYNNIVGFLYSDALKRCVHLYNLYTTRFFDFFIWTPLRDAYTFITYIQQDSWISPFRRP